MKYGKKGELILSRTDYRVGNFVYSNYADYVAFTDIGRTIQTKVSKRTFVGQMLAEAVRGRNENFLHNYAGVIYYLNGVAPDRQFIEDAFKAAESCLKRHPELYGIKEAVSDKEDAEIIQEERDLREFEDDVKAAASVEEGQ